VQTVNHPNIVTIYDIGQSDSVSYIAMELVEGKTLRELLFAGPLLVKKVLSIATQVAEGLARAHEAGIVHRDLKPENLMVTKDGRAKILDFGLAKLTYTGADSGDGTNIPTETGTGAGVVLGTVGYMSPEQASGQPVDFRSDQFSFGSILYELVTGKRAFHKKTGVDTLSAILNDEPEPISAINSQAPTPLRWIVERCLAKDPEGRYASTKDLARELATVRDHLSEASGPSGAIATRESRRRPLIGVIAAAVVSVALGAFLGRQLWKGKLPAPPRFQQVTLQKANINNARFGPDSQTIVYAAGRSDGKFELLQTRPGSRGSRSLGITDAIILSISAEGEMALGQVEESPPLVWLGAKPPKFTLAVAPIGGGEPRALASDVAAADWAPDGKSLAIVRGPGFVGRIEYPIGTPLVERAGGRIRVSPRGDRVLYIEGGISGNLFVVDREKRKVRLVADVQNFGWSPDGSEAWFTRISSGSTHLFAVTLGGRERTLVSMPGDFVLLDVSRDGRVLFERGYEQWLVFGRFPGDEYEHGYRWLDATWPQDLSADGRTLLFVEKEPSFMGGFSYIRKTDGSPAVPLAEGFCKSLSPDGKWAVCRSKMAQGEVRLVSTSGETRNLPNGGLELLRRFGGDWLPDGQHIVFTASQKGRPPRIFLQAVNGSPPVAIGPEGTTLISSATFWAKAVSPDGSLVACLRDGRAALLPIKGGELREIPGLLPGDLLVQWSEDGKTLYLQRDDAPGKIWRLELSSGRRSFFREIRPPQTGLPPGGGPWLLQLLLSRDGQSYVQTYQGWLSDLFVLEGVK
jgi:WD40 repeat protein